MGEAWLLWLLELGIPMDQSTLRLVLSQVAYQMWQYRLEPNPVIKEYLTQCVLRSSQDILASCHLNSTASASRCADRGSLGERGGSAGTGHKTEGKPSRRSRV